MSGVGDGSFVELRVRTNLSFLTGASDTREYIRQAKHLKMPAIGITDLNGVYGLPRALEAIRDGCEDVRLICGADIKIEQHARVSFLAKSRAGWGLLCRLITATHHGHEKGEGFLRVEELIEICHRFEGANGLVCIADVAPESSFSILKDLFQNDLYFALTRYQDGSLDDDRTKLVLAAAKKYSVRIVATNDVQYHEPLRQPLHDCFASVRCGRSLDQADLNHFGNGERYLKSDLQMRALYRDLPEALSLTSEIAASCEFQISDLKSTYPSKFVPTGKTAKEYLEHLCFEGAYQRYGSHIDLKIARQLREELDFVCSRNIEDYFLFHFDVCKHARDMDIYYNARGSSVNSLICYCLFISKIDPVRNKLYFARFLNTARNEPPDIDIDFEHQRREEIIQWIYSRYGRKFAAMVSAIQTYKPDGATIDLSKALGAEIGTVSARVIRTKLESLFGNKKYRTAHLNLLTDMALDSPRHLSTHPGGFFVTDDLPTFVPIEPARMENRTIIQWDKNDLETLQGYKSDILSIGFLTVLHKACALVGITPDQIPYDCKKTFDMIGRGETHGTFQLESRAQINGLQRARPKEQYHLVIGVSVIRPLASVGGMAAAYIKGLNNYRKGIKFVCGNEIIEEILGRTYGIPLFPEQMMQIASRVAGFSDFEAEQLRKALGKSRSVASVLDHSVVLKARLIEKGVNEEFAELLFQYVQGYSSYGFPESHAASYADLAYLSAWLKCHYPTELLIGLLNSQPMGFYAIDTLIYEAQRNGGVQIRPIHPNISSWEATLEARGIVRMGFQNVRSIREETVQAMIEERERKSFTSVEDFIVRTKFSSDILENLALANVFECWGLDRRHSFWQTLEFHRLIKKDTAEKGQLSFFDERAANQPVVNLFTELTLVAEQFLDYRILGYSPNGNPMRGLRLEVRNLPKTTSLDIKRLGNRAFVRYAAIVSVLQRPPPAKGTAFMTLEDEFGAVDVIFHNDVYERYREQIKSSRFLIVEGRIQLKKIEVDGEFHEMRTLIAESCRAFGHAAESKPIQAQAHPRSLGRLPRDFAFSSV